MRELIDHLCHDNLTSLYMNEHNICEYNHIIGIIYGILWRAISDNANILKLTPTHFVWSRNADVLGNFRHDRCEPTLSYYSQFHKMIQYDAILQQHVRIITDTPEELICQLVHQVNT